MNADKRRWKKGFWAGMEPKIFCWFKAVGLLGRREEGLTRRDKEKEESRTKARRGLVRRTNPSDEGSASELNNEGKKKID
ncbi:MAG: hypothetical protein JXR63_07070 [Spirochaetales bacterium]|nr:hypothetical protein [Spirochaetales bacterium]